MDWKLKASVFRGLSLVPFGDDALLLLQRHATREVPRRREALDELLVAARRLLALYRAHEGGLGADTQFLEIGAGRDLAVALALRLLGVPRVVCCDVTRLARMDLVRHAASYMATAVGAPAPRLADWDDVANFGIEYQAPQGMGGLTPGFSCFYSTDVLEHIPEHDLREVLAGARTLLRPAGLAIHAIDYSDHYARSHAGLSRFNFLKYEARDWSRYNPRLHYVNRLRHSQYIDLFERTGYKIVLDEPTKGPVETEILEGMAPEFSRFTLEDLFTLRSWVVASAAR